MRGVLAAVARKNPSLNPKPYILHNPQNPQPSYTRQVRGLSVEVLAAVAKSAPPAALRPLLPQLVGALLEALSSLEDVRCVGGGAWGAVLYCLLMYRMLLHRTLGLLQGGRAGPGRVRGRLGDVGRWPLMLWGHPQAM